MIKINVLKSEKREKGKKKKAFVTGEADKRLTNMFVGVMIVTVLIIAAMWYTQSSKMDQLRQDIDTLTAKKNSPELKNVEKRLKELERKQQVINKKIEIIDRLKKYRTVPVEIIDLLSKNIPDQVWFTFMSYKEGFVKINGYAFSNELVARFITNLEKTDKFSNFNLINTKKLRKGGVEFYSFSMNFKYKMPEVK